MIVGIEHMIGLAFQYLFKPGFQAGDLVGKNYLIGLGPVLAFRVLAALDGEEYGRFRFTDADQQARFPKRARQTHIHEPGGVALVR